MTGGGVDHGAVAKALVESGYGVLGLEKRGTTLEDVFMKSIASEEKLAS